jgi:hypothetical protein
LARAVEDPFGRLRGPPKQPITIIQRTATTRERIAHQQASDPRTPARKVDQHVGRCIAGALWLTAADSRLDCGEQLFAGRVQCLQEAVFAIDEVLIESGSRNSGVRDDLADGQIVGGAFERQLPDRCEQAFALSGPTRSSPGRLARSRSKSLLNLMSLAGSRLLPGVLPWRPAAESRPRHDRDDRRAEAFR